MSAANNDNIPRGMCCSLTHDGRLYRAKGRTSRGRVEREASAKAEESTSSADESIRRGCRHVTQPSRQSARHPTLLSLPIKGRETQPSPFQRPLPTTGRTNPKQVTLPLEGRAGEGWPGPKEQQSNKSQSGQKRGQFSTVERPNSQLFHTPKPPKTFVPYGTTPQITGDSDLSSVLAAEGGYYSASLFIRLPALDAGPTTQLTPEPWTPARGPGRRKLKQILLPTFRSSRLTRSFLYAAQKYQNLDAPHSKTDIKKP